MDIYKLAAEYTIIGAGVATVLFLAAIHQDTFIP